MMAGVYLNRPITVWVVIGVFILVPSGIVLIIILVQCYRYVHSVCKELLIRKRIS